MNSILNKIIQTKKGEVARQKLHIPYTVLNERKRERPFYSLKQALSQKQSSGIIAEFKRKSPSKGWINREAKTAQTVLAYEQAGASACSILTDASFFGGSTQDLEDGAAVLQIPILRKDFIVDPYQIKEAALYGADVILLIAACLHKTEVQKLTSVAMDLGLEVLLEIHSEAELEYLTNDKLIVGVNNRDLHAFKTSLDNSVKLSESIPSNMIKISESGIKSAEDIQLLKQYNYRGFLMGEQFMKEDNPGLACKTLIKSLNYETA